MPTELNEDKDSKIQRLRNGTSIKMLPSHGKPNAHLAAKILLPAIEDRSSHDSDVEIKA